MNYAMRILSVILVLVSLVVLFDGMSMAGSAPQQTVAVAQACFVAILARLAQASGHHLEKNKQV